MKYVLYILGVALVTMFLLYIGYIKDRTLPAELTQRLYRKCRDKVLKQLDKKGTITMSEVKELISNVRASVVWSRRRAGVTNPSQFGKIIIEALLKEGKIEEDQEGKKRVYRLK